MKINIKSNNQFFDTLILRKPNDVIMRQYDTGVVMGKYISENQYSILYHPNMNRTSNLTEDYSNQLDYEHYSHPSIARNVFDEFFRHMFKSKDKYFSKQYEWVDKPNSELDIPCYNSISMKIEIDSNWVNKDNVFVIGKYFDQVLVEHQVGNIYKLTIESNNDTLYNIFNIAMLTVTFILVTNGKHQFYVEDGMVKRFIKILSNIDNLPYFIVYLFKMRLMKSREFFAKVKNSLEDILPMDCNFFYGNTHDMRIDFIRDYLTNNQTSNIVNSVVDIGCGELRYLKALGKYMENGLRYNACDLDESIGAYVDVMKKRDSFNHLILQFSSDLSSFVEKNPIILLSEVIEHNTKEEVRDVIEEILNTYKNLDTFIITTVNKDFNHYYALKNNMRHNDHVFEFSKTEFVKFIDEILDNNYKCEYVNIGDELNGVSPTVAAIIKQK